MNEALAELIAMMIQKQPDDRADWPTIMSSPFFTALSASPALSFSIQIDSHPRLRCSKLPPAPPMITH